jgi:hypothetical protein
MFESNEEMERRLPQDAPQNQPDHFRFAAILAPSLIAGCGVSPVEVMPELASLICRK